MSKKWTAIILSILAVALIVGLIFVKDMDFSKEDKEADTDTKKVESIAVLNMGNTIKEVDIINQGNHYVFVKDGDKWKLTIPEEIKEYDEVRLQNIAGSLESITATKKISKNIKSDDVYGLDKAVLVKVKNDKEEKVLELGNETIDKLGIYLRIQGQKDIYIVSNTTFTAMKITDKDLKNKEITALRSEDINGFSFERDGKLLYETEKKGADEWDVIKPLKTKADYSRLEPIFQAVSTITAQEIVDTKENIAKYGLDKPAFSFTIKTASDNKIKIYLGNEIEGGARVYALVEGKDDIVIIDQSLFTFLDKPLKEIIDPMAFIPNIKNVTEMVVNVKGEKLTSKIKTGNDDKKENDAFTVDGIDMKAKDKTNGDGMFRTFYQSCIGIVIAEIDLDTEKPSGEAEVTIDYKLNTSPGEYRIELISRDNEYYYLMRNGEYANALVSKKAIQEDDECLFKEFKKIQEFVKKHK